MKEQQLGVEVESMRNRVLKNRGMPLILKQLFLQKGWRTFDSEIHKETDWNVNWDVVRLTLEQIKHLEAYQKLNRIPQLGNLPAKHLLHQSLLELKNEYAGSNLWFDFFPGGFVLPEQKDELMKSLQGNEKVLYICKPTRGSGGRNIEFLQDESQLKLLESFSIENPVLVQKYIQNPKLIKGIKFDLRIYVFVLVTDCVQIWVYNDGLARFCAHKYTNDFSDFFAHLTNSALNQRVAGSWSENTKEARETLTSLFGPLEENCSPKWKISNVFAHLQNQEQVNSSKLWQEIYKVIICTIVPSFTKKNNIKHSCQFFELFGFDIMLDSLNKPWLIEVNANPSLELDFQIDEEIKMPMLSSMIDILSSEPKKYDNQNVGGFHHVFNSKSVGDYPFKF